MRQPAWGRFFDTVAGPAAGITVDMGAYENQHIDACKWDIASAGGGAPPDGDVGTPDQIQLLADWGFCPGCGSDFNCDQDVGVNDFLDLLANWGPCPGGESAQGHQGGDSELTLQAALNAMGFFTLDDYGNWLFSVSSDDAFASGVVLLTLLDGDW